MTYLQFVKQSTIRESITDEAYKTLDKKIFTDDLTDWPVLVSSVKDQIMQGVYEFNLLAPVNRVYMVGSILTKRYSSDSDIDVNLEFDDDTTDEITKAKLFDLMKGLNGRMAGQTSHPVNFHLEFVNDMGGLENIKDRFDNIYDVRQDKWLKRSRDLAVNVKNYLDKFAAEVSRLDLATMKIRRDLIDIRKLKEFTPDEIKDLKERIQSKLYEIERAIEMMVTTKQEMAQLRRQAFQKPLSPNELQKLKTKNALPENIIYKLMERYYYWELIEKLHEIAGDDGKIKTSDIDDITKAIKDFNDRIKTVKQPIEDPFEESMSFDEFSRLTEASYGYQPTGEDTFRNTEEDRKFYEAYTKRHIDKVKEIGRKLFMQGKIDDETLAVIEMHDASKLVEPEYSAYVKRKWMAKDKARRGSWMADPIIRDALHHHFAVNPHHPEHWFTSRTKTTGVDMPEEYLWEMLCDWGATSLEHGNTVRSFFEHTNGGKYRWTPKTAKWLDAHVDDIDQIIKGQRFGLLADDGSEIVEISDKTENEAMSYEEFSELQNLTETRHLKKPAGFRTPKPQEPGKSRPSRERKKELTGQRRRRQQNFKAYTKMLDKWREERNEKFPVDEYIPSQFNALKELKQAKKADYGQWFLNPMQARWVSVHYHFDTPTPDDPIKQLSNMPVVLWCSPKGKYYLFKDPRLKGRSKRNKKPFKRLRQPTARKFTKNKFNSRKLLPIPKLEGGRDKKTTTPW